MLERQSKVHHVHETQGIDRDRRPSRMDLYELS